MDHTCRYYPTVMSGPVIRFGFGYDEGLRTEILSGGERIQQWSAEISASRDGVSLDGRFPIYSSRADIDGIKQLLEWAWNAHCAIGPRGDHDAAKRWVEVHNMSLVELRDEAAKITETEKQ